MRKYVMKKYVIKKDVKGTFTIEASIIVPVLLLIFSVIVTMLFYFHDKNVVSAITHETLAMGCSRDEISEEELEKYFLSRLDGKFILFTMPIVEANIDGEQIYMECTAKKEKMRLHVEMEMRHTDPEKRIWKHRRLEKLEEDIKDTVIENIENSTEKNTKE